jgi:hypothetical protein
MLGVTMLLAVELCDESGLGIEEVSYPQFLPARSKIGTFTSGRGKLASSW